jgi:RND family efflux transporter MFP subunit
MLGGLGYVGYTRLEQFRPPPQVQTTTVQAMTSGEAEKLLSAKGYLKARMQAAVGTKIPGRVQELLVDEGSKVGEGDLIAVLEHNELDALVRIRQAMFEQGKAQVLEAEAELREKQRAFDRTIQLAQKNNATRDELDKAISARDMADARAAALRLALDVMEAQIGEVQEQIRNMEIRAPFAGTIVRLEAEEGETISTMSLGTGGGRSAIITLADLDHLEVDTDVAENLLSRIVEGQPAEVVVSAVPGKAYRGRLKKIIPQGDRSRGTVKVEVEILDPDTRLFPELAATVHFLPDSSLQNPNAGRTMLFVSKSAIVEEGGHSHVWVVQAGGKLEKRRIEVVSTSRDNLARVDSGLKGGEVVVVGPGPELKAGMAVRTAD